MEETKVTITKLTLEQLKAQAYDCLVNIQAWQNKLKEVNQAIVEWKPEEEK